MNFSPQDRQVILHEAAEIVAREVLARVGDPAELVVLPVPAVAALSGLTPKKVVQVMPVTDQGHKTKGVTVADYRRYLAERQPKKPAENTLPFEAGRKEGQA